MKRVALIVLAVALLCVAGAAWAECKDYGCDHHGYYYSTSRYYTAYPPPHMRTKIAEAEKLKASYHYYSMSCTPHDVATAKYMAAELDAVLAEIDAWYCNIR